MKFVTTLAIAALGSILVACGGGGGDAGSGSGGGGSGTYTASKGVAQKGPLALGSVVFAQELDAGLAPTGRQFSYQVTSNLGTFSPTSTFASRYVGLLANGYYFDEVAGTVSTGTVALNAYADLQASSVLNVNLLTTLAYQRIQRLMVGSGMSYAAASLQAETEVLRALKMPVGTRASFGELDLGGGTDGDHMLAAISSLFVYGNGPGALSALIANFQADIGINGVLTNAATSTALAAAAAAVDPAAVAAHLTQAYAASGVSFTADQIAQWIDADGDGVIGRMEFRVADATPASTLSLPSFVASQLAGTAISVSTGQLIVNGTPVIGAVTVQSGDTIAVSPGNGSFVSGAFTLYLKAGADPVARVSFVRGLAAIVVTPGDSSLPAGATQPFVATGAYTDGSSAALTAGVTWSSSAGAVAKVDPVSGLVTSLSPGTTQISASSGSIAGTTGLTVTTAVVRSIAVSPNPAFVGIGISSQMTAIATYSDGTTADVTRAVAWSSGAPAVATVDSASGRTLGVALGTTQITASASSIQGSTSLSVTRGAWSPSGPLAIGLFWHTATRLQNGKVLVAGGDQRGQRAVGFAQVYDPLTGVWARTADLARTRYLHSATLLSDGRVLVAGGTNFGSDGVDASAELYDPTTGSWSPTGSLTYKRMQHVAVALPNGKVLVFGGSGGTGTPPSMDPAQHAELFDPGTGVWTAAANPIFSFAPNASGTAVLPGGRVLALGTVVVGGVQTPSAQLYDGATNTWSNVAAPSMVRSTYCVALMSNGRVLLTGGDTSGATKPAEVYDPAAGAWSFTGSPLVPRTVGPVSIALPDGRVMVGGGVDYDRTELTSVELYDPGTGTWSATGSMSVLRRYGFTVTVLDDGAVLVVGGDGGGGAGLDSTEVYW